MSIDISKLTLEEKIGQMLGLSFYGTTYTKELAYQIEELKAGLIIYFKDNCISPKQVFDLNKEINKHAKIPPFIALDQEGGMVARVTTGITQSPGAMAISAGSSVDDCYKLAYNMGYELRQLGFNFNFAPEADVNCNPLNPVINVRSYSDDPYIVADYMSAAVKGYHDAKMMTSVKHFPGHGDTAVDSHVGLPVVDFDDKRLNDVELVPFKRVVKDDLPGIMASHVLFKNLDEEYPTTLSKKVITDLLRHQLNFKGLVVTDSLTMKAVWGRYPLEEICYRSIMAGCDIILFCGPRSLEDHKRIKNACIKLVDEGKIPLSIIDEACTRILKYKALYQCGEMANNFHDIEKELEEPSRMEFSLASSLRSITVLKDDAKIIPIKPDEKILVVFPIIKVVTLVENDDNTLNSLGDFIPFKVDKLYLPIDPTEKDLANMLSNVQKYDKIIYCSYNACFNESQSLLINRLPKNKLMVIAIRTPYDINVLDVKSYMMSYEASTLAFKALAKVLTNEVEAKGICPVKLKQELN